VKLGGVGWGKCVRGLDERDEIFDLRA
jgi:hypothetical protein